MKAQIKRWQPQGHVETPYQRAKQEWDNRIGSIVLQCRNWRLACFASILFIAFPSLLGAIYLGTQPKAIPHIVEIDENGAVSYRGEIGQSWQNYEPSSAAIQYHLRRFIDDTRSISSDPTVTKQRWYDAYQLLTTKAANTLNTYVREQDPFKRAEQERISIDIISMVPLSKNSWQIDWKETAWNKKGLMKNQHNWRGIFKLDIHKPRTEKQIEVNPIGLYIDEFYWSKLK